MIKAMPLCEMLGSRDEVKSEFLTFVDVRKKFYKLLSMS